MSSITKHLQSKTQLREIQGVVELREMHGVVEVELDFHFPRTRISADQVRPMYLEIIFSANLLSSMFDCQKLFLSVVQEARVYANKVHPARPDFQSKHMSGCDDWLSKGQHPLTGVGSIKNSCNCLCTSWRCTRTQPLLFCCQRCFLKCCAAPRGRCRSFTQRAERFPQSTVATFCHLSFFPLSPCTWSYDTRNSKPPLPTRVPSCRQRALDGASRW